MEKNIPLLDSIDDWHKCTLDVKDFKNLDGFEDARFSQEVINEGVKVLKE